MYVDVDVEQEEKEEWAKPLVQLWQSRPFNPQAEWEYNKRMGQQAPYCCICLIFHTHNQVRTKGCPEKYLQEFAHFTFLF